MRDGPPRPAVEPVLRPEDGDAERAHELHPGRHHQREAEPDNHAGHGQEHQGVGHPQPQVRADHHGQDALPPGGPHRVHALRREQALAGDVDAEAAGVAPAEPQQEQQPRALEPGEHGPVQPQLQAGGERRPRLDGVHMGRGDGQAHVPLRGRARRQEDHGHVVRQPPAAANHRRGGRHGEDVELQQRLVPEDVPEPHQRRGHRADLRHGRPPQPQQARHRCWVEPQGDVLGGPRPQERRDAAPAVARPRRRHPCHGHPGALQPRHRQQRRRHRGVEHRERRAAVQDPDEAAGALRRGAGPRVPGQLGGRAGVPSQGAQPPRLGQRGRHAAHVECPERHSGPGARLRPHARGERARARAGRGGPAPPERRLHRLREAVGHLLAGVRGGARELAPEGRRDRRAGALARPHRGDRERGARAVPGLRGLLGHGRLGHAGARVGGARHARRRVRRGRVAPGRPGDVAGDGGGADNVRGRHCAGGVVSQGEGRGERGGAEREGGGRGGGGADDRALPQGVPHQAAALGAAGAQAAADCQAGVHPAVPERAQPPRRHRAQAHPHPPPPRYRGPQATLEAGEAGRARGGLEPWGHAAVDGARWHAAARHERLARPRRPAGQPRAAGWLAAPAPEHCHRRQAAVRRARGPALERHGSLRLYGRRDPIVA
mmetsp:Transcript_13242/g.45808  ORF Transcript_13242/g.45808 Transcript_13242/m.45808 type:complete len:661 (+) Transcript_13242:1214-3196(+)